MENIPLDQYEKTQIIDEEKIIVAFAKKEIKKILLIRYFIFVEHANKIYAQYAKIIITKIII